MGTVTLALCREVIVALSRARHHFSFLQPAMMLMTAPPVARIAPHTSDARPSTSRDSGGWGSGLGLEVVGCGDGAKLLEGETVGAADSAGSGATGEAVGELVVGAAVGCGLLGLEVVGSVTGAAVGCELAGDLVGEPVGSAVVGDCVSEVVGSAVIGD